MQTMAERVFKSPDILYLSEKSENRGYARYHIA
jgi:hypothetical protein